MWTYRKILAYGVRIAIRANDPDLLVRLGEHLPPLWRPSAARRADRTFSIKVESGRRHLYELFEGPKRVLKSPSLKAILEDFERRAKLYIAEMARRRVFIHAGAVGYQGRAIIIPGGSMSGKTTLVRELVRAGAHYYSDEYAVVDALGRIHPYPQPLALRQNGSLKQKKLSPEELGAVIATAPLEVGLIVFSRYKPGANWRARRLSAAEAMLELLLHAVPIRRRPETVLAALQKIALNSTALKAIRGEAERASSVIIQIATKMNP
jgi:hypothetical protein